MDKVRNVMWLCVSEWVVIVAVVLVVVVVAVCVCVSESWIVMIVSKLCDEWCRST